MAADVADAVESPQTRLVDADIHPTLRTDLAAIFAYLPPAWRKKFEFLGKLPIAAPPLAFTFLGGAHAVGIEAAPKLELAQEPDLLSIANAVFVDDGAGIGQLVVPEAVTHSVSARWSGVGAHLVGAFNDYLLDQWIVDERMRYALVVFPGDPEAAVAEIRRHGGDRRVSSVWLPSTEVRFGDSRWYPIYEAALEFGLPILSHPAGGTTFATPEVVLTARMNAPLAAWPNITSLVASGVFERYPELQVVFAECGFSWLDPLVERMEAAWRASGGRVAGLVRAPSQIVREHIRITTAPADDDRDPVTVCRTIAEEGSLLPDVLIYAGNYPRSRELRPSAAFDSLEETLRRRILAGNAEQVLSL